MSRIGLVADTHHPEFLKRLPDSLFDSLAQARVDLILHAGDVGGPQTLDQLAQVAPVRAVRGDHDGGMDLPAELVIEVDGRRIVVVHGNRSRLIEEPLTLVGTISLGHVWPDARLRHWLRRRYPEADVIVYGHTHTAVAEDIGGTLVVNPGAVYQVTPEEALARLGREPGWFEWSWLQVVRHRLRWPQPSVAILDISPEGLVLTVVALVDPVRPLGKLV
jgi:putative phosphoesterase